MLWASLACAHVGESVGLSKLANLVSTGQLQTHVEVEEPWDKVVEVTQALTDRRYVGKAVLHVT